MKYHYYLELILAIVVEVTLVGVVLAYYPLVAAFFLLALLVASLVSGLLRVSNLEGILKSFGIDLEVLTLSPQGFFISARNSCIPIG